jgi:hypothetical protein
MYQRIPKLLKFILAFALFTSLISACIIKKTKKLQKAQLLQQCPEEWIQNKMPSTDGSGTSEYFILEGKKHELKEFDLEWIKKNCDIKPQIVQ